jgi:hypothetical protein
MLDLGIIAVMLRLLKFYKKRLLKVIARTANHDTLYEVYSSELDKCEELEELLEALQNLELQEL